MSYAIGKRINEIRLQKKVNQEEIANVLAERTKSEVVQVIGKKIVLYKPLKKDPKIILPN